MVKKAEMTMTTPVADLLYISSTCHSPKLKYCTISGSTWENTEYSVVANVNSKRIYCVTTYAKNVLWFLIPTQLLIQGQWWSNRSTQRWQTWQWRDLLVFRMPHSGHSYVASNSLSSFIKGTCAWICPGSFKLTAPKNMIVKTTRAVLTMTRGIGSPI